MAQKFTQDNVPEEIKKKFPALIKKFNSLHEQSSYAA